MTCRITPLYLLKDYKRNVEEIFNSLKLSRDNSFYVQNASVTDPTLAPAGKSALYILTPVPNNRSGIDWEAEKDRFAEQILDQVVARTELKDLRDHIEVRKVITPVTGSRITTSTRARRSTSAMSCCR